MNSGADCSTPSVSSSTSVGRRLFHKVTSQFGQKSRSIAEFFVEIEKPHKYHWPGETIRGIVHVKVIKPVRVTHISLCLHGFVQVLKTPSSTAETLARGSSRIGTRQGKKQGEYFGNGFATLFEDESVLCGEGRLAEGAYGFEFEVALPDDLNLPTSVYFERGIIAYMVTATLTRPAAINPVMTHDHLVRVREYIDISKVAPQKAKTITLEAVPRKTRAKTSTKRLTSALEVQQVKSSPSAPPSVATRNSLASSAPSALPDHHSLRTPSISEASIDSGVSSSAGRASTSGSAYHSVHTSDVALNGRSSAAKTITVTVETLKSACLPGDAIPVKIVINHTKHIRSINGVIITLYRKAQTDMHPALPLGPMTDRKNRKYEDYYPRSLTGLGGLSLSGAGSSHVFRKDLSQTIVPLIIDPQSLTAEINAKIAFPEDEDAIPTTTTVPGSMISFKYCVEVVIDIQGKMAGQTKYSSQYSTSSPFSTYVGLTPDGESFSNNNERREYFMARGGGIIDTAPIRREKSVVTCNLECVLGTADTGRHKGKGKAAVEPVDENVIDTSQYARPAPIPEQASTSDPSAAYAYPEGYNWHQGSDQYWNEQDYWQWDPQYGYGDYYDDGSYGAYYDYDYYGHDPAQYAPPRLESEEALPEKERMRRAEARLMPSQPPLEGREDSLETPDPSAPVLSEEEAATTGADRTPNLSMRIPHIVPTAGPSAPYSRSYSGNNARSNGHTDVNPASDDKQELQRRQMLMAASAPSAPVEMLHDMEAEAGPSVPAMHEGTEDAAYEANRAGEERRAEHLPTYYQ